MCASVAASATLAGPAFALDVAATTTADVTADDGQTSLREALAEASASREPSRVTLTSAVYTLTDCAAGPLTVPAGAEIVVLGEGARIVQGCPDQPSVAAIGRLEVRQVTLAGAPQAPAVAESRRDGELWLRDVTVVGGEGAGLACRDCGELVAIRVRVEGARSSGVRAITEQRSQVVVRDSTIAGNSAVGPGGGVLVQSTGRVPSRVFIFRSTITDNRSDGEGAGGAGIAVVGADTYISRTTVRGNSAGSDQFVADGGGIRFTVGRVPEVGITIADSVIAANQATLAGGGVSITGGGLMQILNTWVDANRTGGQGGGAALAPTSTARVVVSRSTFSSNAAGPASGGGGLSLMGPARSATITASTFAANSAGRGGGVDLGLDVDAALTWSTLSDNASPRGAGLAVSGTARASLATSIVGRGRGGEPACATGEAAVLQSRGASVIGDGSCGVGDGDVVDATPGLGDLGSGAVALPPVAVPLSTSPAVGRVPAARCEGVEDQRGVARDGRACTAGAIEIPR